MKLHGARKLGSTSALLSNIDKYVKKAKIWPFWPWKRTFKAIQSNLSFDSSLVPFFGSSMVPKFQLLNSFWSKWPSNAKRAKFRDLFNLEKLPLERFNQICLSICDLCHPNEASCQKRGKVNSSVSEIDPSPPHSWRTDGRTDRHVYGRTDRQTDDGQIGIRKAPLPFGWQELIKK